MRLIDTNMLLHAVNTAPDEQVRAIIARQLLEDDDWVASVQVLQEFYAQATRASKPDRLSHDDAAALVDAWLRFDVQAVTSDDGVRVVNPFA